MLETIKKILIKVRKILTIFLFVNILLMFYIKFNIYKTTKKYSYLDKQIEEAIEKKNILEIDLSYLTSTERLMKLIENNPKILDKKENIKYPQIKTKKELENISYAKLINNPDKATKIAKNSIITSYK